VVHVVNRRALLTAGVGLGAASLLSTSAFASTPRAVITTSKQKILWVWAHPDDETIQGGVSLRQHLEAKLADGTPRYEIHLLSVTRGRETSVLSYLNGVGPAPNKLADWAMPHDPVAEGYEDGILTPASLGAARMRELDNALGVFQSGTGNQVYRWELGLTDGSVTTPDVVAGVQAWYAAHCVPGELLWLKGHTWLIDTGSDHLAVGNALKQLGPTLAGGNVRYYILPPFYTDTRLPLFDILPATGTYQRAATLNAMKSFNSWAPQQGLYAIGHQSVPGDWLASPKNRYHV
jgi:hypothetical protein